MIRNLDPFQAFSVVLGTHLPLSWCKPREESSLPGDRTQPFTLIQQANIKQIWKTESGSGLFYLQKPETTPIPHHRSTSINLSWSVLFVYIYNRNKAWTSSEFQHPEMQSLTPVSYITQYSWWDTELKETKINTVELPCCQSNSVTDFKTIGSKLFHC